jgi:lipoate-protein ligase A
MSVVNVRMTEWRLLDTGVLTGAQNMALDDVILECRSENKTPNTVRFLQFDPPTALVGYHQSIEQEIRVDYCQRHGVDINRRITGGGAILFTPTCLGWEIFADKSAPGISELRRDLDRLARFVCSGAVSSLRRLGVEAEFRPKNDIEVNGRKISGTGGTERGDSFMYQGTLLVDFDVDLMLRSLRIPVEKLKDKEVESVKERVTCLKWELGYVPPLDEIKDAFVAGFQEILDTELGLGDLLPVEEQLYRERLPYIESEEWVRLVRRPKETAGQVNAVRKTPGGLIRVSLALDVPGNFIISSFITGDFQVFPQRAIMDLEARMKNISADEDTIRETIIKFFEDSGARIFGVEPEDLVQILLEAVKKTAFIKYGVSLEDSNHLMTGDIYEIAEEFDVPTRTIQTFEHLIETIDEFKLKGARGYIGSCCEAFYTKHHEDFVDTEVPALLVDIDDSTCYELGEEREAYIGDFEGQTDLKLDLLIHILKKMRDGGNLRSEVSSD